MNKKIILVIVGTLVVWSFFAAPTHAGINTCSVSVSPNRIATNISGTLNFVVTNQDAALDIKWIKISAPSEDFEILSGSGAGWPGSVGSPTEISYHGALGAGNGVSLNTNVQTGINSVAAKSWTVQASDQEDGSGAVACGGDTGVAIGGPGMDSTPPSISGISVTEISSSGAKIRWTTNEQATSLVEFGKTADYGDKKESVDLTTTHEIVLTGLQSETTYHYRIKSADSADNVAQTADNTFTTAKGDSLPEPTPTPTTATGSESGNGGQDDNGSSGGDHSNLIIATPKPPRKPKPTATPTVVIVPVVEKDIVPPRVVINTNLGQPFTDSPVISGRASDESGIITVDYSIDGGGNWLPLPIKIGQKNVSFSFNPGLQVEDSYRLIVRAQDASGNFGTVQKKIVIDRLPPAVGSAYLSFGPQAILPNSSDWFETIEGVDLKIVLSATGGPEIVDLIAEKDGAQQLFSLAKNNETGLWFGTISIASPGDYVVKVRAKDGADRTITRDLLNFHVLPKAQIQDFFGKPIEQGEISVYTRDESAHRFVLWDAVPFGLLNPVKLTKDGRFPLILPPGEYYLLARKGGFYLGRSAIFRVDKVSALPVIAKTAKKTFWNNIFSRFWPTTMSLQFNFAEQEKSSQTALVGAELPPVNFFNRDGEVSTKSFRGKPTVVTFLADWLPDTAELLTSLGELDQAKVSVVGVFSQSSVVEGELFQRRGGYKLNLLADPNGEATVPFDIHALPTTYFADKDGVIRAIRAGILTKQDIEAEIARLGLIK